VQSRLYLALDEASEYCQAPAKEGNNGPETRHKASYTETLNLYVLDRPCRMVNLAFMRRSMFPQPSWFGVHSHTAKSHEWVKPILGSL